MPAEFIDNRQTIHYIALQSENMVFMKEKNYVSINGQCCRNPRHYRRFFNS